MALAAHGIGVAPGTPFCVSPLAADHLRVTVSAVRDGVPALADALAAAASGAARRSGPVGR